MNTDWRKEVPHWLILAAVAVSAIVGLAQAPDQIPIHWNVKGEVDDWGSKWLGLLIGPTVATSIYVLMLFLPRLDPAKRNYQRFAGAYYALRLAILLMMAAIHAIVVVAALGIDVNVGLWIMLGVGALFVVIGWIMADIEPNWFVGVRTPWTLTSELSWKKTHRLARWVFMLAGSLFAIAGIYQQPWAMFVAIGAMVAGVLWLLVYSYIVWKHDPDRIEAPRVH